MKANKTNKTKTNKTNKTNKHVPRICSSYLDNYLEPKKLKAKVNHAAKILKNFDFDAIAFRGMSGALTAPALAMKLGKTLLMVRKETTDYNYCHTSRIVEGDVAAKKYVIVDDMISSGATIRSIKKAVHKEAPKAECIGVLLMNQVNGVEVNDPDALKLGEYNEQRTEVHFR